MIAWIDAAINWIFATLYLCPQGTGVRQEHVALSFTHLCESSPFGMAMRLYLDNGSEYQWEDMLKAWSELAYLAGNKTHVEIAAMLPPAGKIVRSIPFRPRGKLIEARSATCATCSAGTQHSKAETAWPNAAPTSAKQSNRSLTTNCRHSWPPRWPTITPPRKVDT
jgi:hypothetical protein